MARRIHQDREKYCQLGSHQVKQLFSVGLMMTQSKVPNSERAQTFESLAMGCFECLTKYLKSEAVTRTFASMYQTMLRKLDRKAAVTRMDKQFVKTGRR